MIRAIWEDEGQALIEQQIQDEGARNAPEPARYRPYVLLAEDHQQYAAG